MGRQISKSRHSTLLNSWLDVPLTSLARVSLCRQSHYSSTEVSFQNSWQNSADYVAAAHFQSNLENAARFIAPLPSRVLQVRAHESHTFSKPGAYPPPLHSSVTPWHVGGFQATDSAPNIADLSQEENNTLRVFSWMDNINRLLGKADTHTHTQMFNVALFYCTDELDHLVVHQAVHWGACGGVPCVQWLRGRGAESCWARSC